MARNALLRQFAARAKRKVLAVTMTVTLVFGLWPGVAVADDDIWDGNDSKSISSDSAHVRVGSLEAISASDIGLTAQSGSLSANMKIKQVSMGDQGTIGVLMDDGSLWLWGFNTQYQLCTTHNENVSLPMRVMTDVAYISCGDGHCAAVKNDGTLWTWGLISDALGNGAVMAEVSPRLRMVMDDAKTVACGRYATAAIKKDDSLWTWGLNSNAGAGQLGDGTYTNHSYSTKIMDDVAHVEWGTFFGGAIKKDGSLWMWGENGSGQLGNGTLNSSNVPIKVMEDVADVSFGSQHAAAIKTDGSLWMWGSNTSGQLSSNWETLGNGKYSAQNPIPNKIMEDVASVSCGAGWTLVVKKDGSLLSFGANSGGALGNGEKNSEKYYDPIIVASDVASSFATTGYGNVPGGGANSAAIKNDGSLWIWGNNQYGQLGNGAKDDQYLPVCIFRNGQWLYGSSNIAQQPELITTDFDIESVSFAYNRVDQGKNLLKDVVTLSLGNRDTPLSFRVEFADDSANVGKIQLAYYEAGGLGGRDVPEIIATANSRYEFEGMKVGDFKAGRPLAILVYDEDGNMRNAAGLTLSIRDDPGELAAELDFGDGFTFTIADGVLAGKSLNFGDFKCPITWKVSTEGVLQLGINFDIGSDSVLEQLKEGATLKTSAKTLSTAMLKPELGQAFAKSLVNPVFSIIGYAEGSISSNVLTGRISVKMGASVYQEFQAGIFVGELSGSLAGVATTTAQIDSLASPREMVKNAAFDLGVEGSIGAYGGVGAAYVASVGVYGKATGSLTYRLAPQSQSGLLDATIKGEMGVKVKALGRNVGNIAFVKGEYPLYRRDSNYSLSALSIASVLAGDFVDVDAAGSLIEGGGSAVESWAAREVEGLSTMSAQSVGGSGSAILASDVYPDASPRLVSVGDTVALFFLDSATGRAAANRSELVYSVFDPSAKTWSSPKAVEDDGTADFGFDVFASGDRIDVVWQDATGDLSSVGTLEETARAVQVSYASIEVPTGGASAAEVVFAAGNGYPLLPRVASREGVVEIAWVSNDAYSATAAEGANTVKKATRASAVDSWSVQDVALLGSAMPTSLDVGVEGLTLSVAWSYDLDGNISDTSDGCVSSELGGNLTHMTRTLVK